MRMRSFVVAAAVLSASLAARASSITYSIDLTAGGASAVGTIETDGATGVLSLSDILDYTFTVSKGASTNTFSDTGNGILAGSDLTATNTGLFFNFSGTDYGGSFLPDSGDTNYLCLVDSVTYCNGTSTSIQIVIGGVLSAQEASGNQEIGTAVTATPEPSSLALLGTGVLALAGGIRRRRLI